MPSAGETARQPKRGQVYFNRSNQFNITNLLAVRITLYAKKNIHLKIEVVTE
jgi:hypothetical protein